MGHGHSKHYQKVFSKTVIIRVKSKVSKCMMQVMRWKMRVCPRIANLVGDRFWTQNGEFHRKVEALEDTDFFFKPFHWNIFIYDCAIITQYVEKASNVFNLQSLSLVSNYETKFFVRLSCPILHQFTIVYKSVWVWDKDFTSPFVWLHMSQRGMRARVTRLPSSVGIWFWRVITEDTAHLSQAIDQSLFVTVKFV